MNPSIRPKAALSILPGDWNLPADTVARIASLLGGRLQRGHGVDHSITRGPIEHLGTVRVQQPGSPGHPAIVYRYRIDGERFDVLSWNVYVGQRPDLVLRTLRELVARFDPDVIALSETYRCRPRLEQLDGYRLSQGQPASAASDQSERAETAVLTHERHELASRGVLRMTTPWKGPHGNRHGGRQYRTARIRVGEARRIVRIAVPHLPTGGLGGPNSGAVRESMAELVKWARRA